MTRRFLNGALAGVLFAVICLAAAVKQAVADVFSRKQEQR